MRKTKLKLFVWTDYSPDYTPGLAFAIAKDEADARNQIKEKRGFQVYTWGNLKIYPLNRRHAEAVSGGG